MGTFGYLVHDAATPQGGGQKNRLQLAITGYFRTDCIAACPETARDLRSVLKPAIYEKGRPRACCIIKFDFSAAGRQALNPPGRLAIS